MRHELTAKELALEEYMKASMAKSPDVEHGAQVYAPSAEEEEYLSSVKDADPGPEPVSGVGLAPAFAPGQGSGQQSPVAGEEPERSAPSKQSGRRKKEVQDYRSLFLVNNPTRIRFQTYISQELYDQIKKVLPVIAPYTSISSFISNVLNHHLRLFQDEINELYAIARSEKPINYEKD